MKKTARRMTFMAQVPNGMESLQYSDLGRIGLAKQKVQKATPAEKLKIIPKSKKVEKVEPNYIHESGKFLVTVHEESPRGFIVTTFGLYKNKWHIGTHLIIPKENFSKFTPTEIILFDDFRGERGKEIDRGNTIFDGPFVSKQITTELCKEIGITG